jgi:CRP-like cAMP-binding protein
MPDNWRPHADDVAKRLLNGVALDGQREILAGSRRRMFRPAQVLFRTGESAERLFVLRKGRVQFARTASTGQEVVMGILVPGDVFGLSSLLDAEFAYIGTAEALEACETLVWSRDVIQRFAQEYPRLSANALKVALGYVAIFAERHEQLIASTAEQRLARALTRLGAETGTASRPGLEVRIKNEQLASLADVSPFTASRVLNSWQRDGAISKTRGIVHIVSPERLLLS